MLMIAALLSVAACDQKNAAPAPAKDSAGPTERQAAETPVPTLEGQWRVEALDGRPVGAVSAMTATFKGSKVTLSTGCLRRAWTYTQKRNLVTFAADPAGSANCGGGTTGEQETAYAALEQASIAIFNRDGSEANLSGTGGNLTLQRR